jgi:hypothetical protein
MPCALELERHATLLHLAHRPPFADCEGDAERRDAQVDAGIWLVLLAHFE